MFAYAGATMQHCCQSVFSSRYMRVDDLFSFWRRLTRHQQALKQSHINLRRQVVIPFTEPSSAQVVPHCDRLPTYNKGILALPLFGALNMLSTASSAARPLLRCQRIHNWDAGGSEPSTSAQALMQPEVHMMLHGHGYNAKPVPSWRKCPLILASRRAEFRPVAADMAPEIRPLPESVRSSLLPRGKRFRPQQIDHYNRMLKWDGKLVSGVDKAAARARTKPGRLVHKFDSLCALATSKAGRLLLLQHRQLNHVFYALCCDPGHKLYNELLNMYERRWFVVSKSYGKKKET